MLILFGRSLATHQSPNRILSSSISKVRLLLLALPDRHFQIRRRNGGVTRRCCTKTPDLESGCVVWPESRGETYTGAVIARHPSFAHRLFSFGAATEYEINDSDQINVLGGAKIRALAVHDGQQEVVTVTVLSCQLNVLTDR